MISKISRCRICGSSIFYAPYEWIHVLGSFGKHSAVPGRIRYLPPGGLARDLLEWDRSRKSDQ